MKDFGVALFEYGAIFHRDGRHRKRSAFGGFYRLPEPWRGGAARGQIKAFSHGSRRRLEFAAANVAGRFRTLLTLTYHANVENWEDDGERNRRIAERTKRDLNRFLTCMRKALGDYLWVQEFQARGVVHYHVLCTGEPSAERVSVAWCRATGELDDAAALRHAAKTEQIGHERSARGYLGRYLGKARQKVLPPGIEGIGRWWGRSRGLKFLLLEEVLAGEAWSLRANREGIRIMRCLRRYVGKVFKGKFRGGMFIDWGGGLTSRLQSLVVRLREYYGTPRRLEELLAAHGWEAVGEAGNGRRGDDAGVHANAAEASGETNQAA